MATVPHGHSLVWLPQWAHLNVQVVILSDCSQLSQQGSCAGWSEAGSHHRLHERVLTKKKRNRRDGGVTEDLKILDQMQTYVDLSSVHHIVESYLFVQELCDEPWGNKTMIVNHLEQPHLHIWKCPETFTATKTSVQTTSVGDCGCKCLCIKCW